MIRSDPHWGIGEWIVVLLWKGATLAIAIIMGYFMIVGPELSLHIVASFYSPLALAAFLFTQPDV